MKAQKANEQTRELPVLRGQLTFDDVLDNYDDGTYGKPIDEYEAQ